MTVPAGDCFALSVQFSEKRVVAGLHISLARMLVVGVLSAFALGCLPDSNNGDGRVIQGPVSNVAAKTDRLDTGSAVAASDVRVATTATVIPTSAPEPGDNLLPSAPPVPADEALKHFFDALAALDRGDRQEPVTILHLGDEHIAADRITEELRTQFQSRFGDAGRGMMAPGVFRVARARIERKGDWRVASSAAGDKGPFGLTGVRLTGRDGATLRMSLPDAPFDWAEITFATGPGTGKAYVAVDDKGDVVSTRTAAETWQRIKINAAGSSLTVRAENADPVRLLSWRVVRERKGVRYVNLGVPGATIATHDTLQDAFVKADLTRLAPDLIIISYGSNSAFDDNLDTETYAGEAESLIKRLRAIVPLASFLAIGPPDLAQIPNFADTENTDACRALTVEERANYARLLGKEDPRLARWHPPIKLRTVRQALRAVAAQNGVFFWDWSRVMGGPCSIHTWVHAVPPLAAGNHRHFTAEGAQKSARALFRDLVEAYERYRTRTATAQN